MTPAARMRLPSKRYGSGKEFRGSGFRICWWVSRIRFRVWGVRWLGGVGKSGFGFGLGSRFQ